MASHRIFFCISIASLSLFGCSAYVVGSASEARHFPSVCQGKMTPKASLHATTNAQRLHTVAVGQSDSSAADAADMPSRVPEFIRKLNSNTKWLVTIGNTIGVWIRPHSFRGPFIIAGAIASVYFTDVLKKMINQTDRIPLFLSIRECQVRTHW